MFDTTKDRTSLCIVAFGCFISFTSGSFVMSLDTTSRVWSCQTLHDGIDQLMEDANKAEEEVIELEKLIQD